MSEHNETLAEIVAVMRRGFDQSWHDINREWAYGLADRIEAAHKREVDKLNSVIQAQRSAFDAEQDRQRRAAPGNAAAKRKALEKINRLCGIGVVEVSSFEIGSICDAALAAPSRNCDRYNSGDPAKDADNAYAEWQRQCDAVDVPPSCKVESAFRQWIFATAKPETEGENDGGK